jgi:putative ABC transport system ATP-binding protein
VSDEHALGHGSLDDARRTGMPVIECIDVHKRFGSVEALHGIDLTVDAGEFVAISGPSGCGKSTLLHLLAALDQATSGRVIVNGHDLAKLHAVNRYRRHDVGIVFQLHNLLPHMTAGRNVELAMFGTDRTTRERADRAAELLTMLDLAQAIDRTPSRLSGGERQRVAIARALANEPHILLADEPTGSLDRAASATVLSLFEQLRTEQGVTIVLVTHDPTVAARADRHLHLRRGRVDLAGTRHAPRRRERSVPPAVPPPVAGDPDR